MMNNEESIVDNEKLKIKNDKSIKHSIKETINEFRKENEKIIHGDDLSKYGKEFQIKLISLLIKDRVFSFSIIPIIKAEYFSDVYLRKIYVSIKEYMEQYYSCPTIDNIKILLQSKNEKMIIYNELLKRIDEITFEDRDFIIDNARKFCFSKYALIELEKTKILLEEGDFAKAKKVSLEAFKHSGFDKRKIYDLKEDYDKIFQDDVLHRPIELPFPSFNKASKGGPGNGNLVVLVAFSNFGKTACLTACARHANAIGKNVALFSYEIGGVDILRRYIAGVMGEKQENLKYHKSKIKERIVDSTLGNFRLIEQRATLANTETLRNDLEWLKSTGFFPDLICVDSLNQLKLTNFRAKSDNEKFEYLSEDLRDLANDYEVPVITPFQSNRSGSNNKILNVDSIGKAIEPFQVADMLITFGQDNEMLLDNKCTALLLKNRLGPKNICIECFYDPNLGVFKELGQINEILLLNDKQRQDMKNTVKEIRQKLNLKDFMSK